MARQIIVLALVFVAIVGLVSAESPAPAPKSSTKTSSAASAPVTSTSTKPSSSDDDVIGATDGPSVDIAVEAPLGGPLAEDAFGPSSDDKPTLSGAATLQASAIVGVAAVAGFFF